MSNPDAHTVTQNIIWCPCTTICHHHFCQEFLLQIKPKVTGNVLTANKRVSGEGGRNTAVIKHIHEQYGSRHSQHYFPVTALVYQYKYLSKSN